jgi:hypothetical protein
MDRSLLALLAIVVAAPAGSHGTVPPPMWPVFTRGSWKMTSSVNHHVTTFTVRHLDNWACWKGDLIDLRTNKQAPEDYWAPGLNVVGHQILLRDKDGSVRMVGTYTQSPDPAERWTMQVHSYPGRPVAYVITPGRRVASDTRTAYYTLYSASIEPRCMRGGESAAPGWGRNVYWRSRFVFDKRGWLHAHYEENLGCGAIACQIENWTFACARAGIEQINDTRVAGKPIALVLRRNR